MMCLRIWSTSSATIPRLDDVDSESADAAITWYSDHWLYLGYLRDSPEIYCRRRVGRVTIDWEVPASSPNKFVVPRTGAVTVEVKEARRS
jgi:uncharacterized protein DUF5984